MIGQTAAKRAVAIALRNRMRRQKLSPELAEEIAPKNILMIGPTGVGKTEIARRLARLAQSPFVKVEASKFTEVGYVGRDVESMVRDLVELAVDMVREERLEEVRAKAAQNAEERLLDVLLPPARPIAPDEDADRGARSAAVRPASAFASSSAPAGSTSASSSSTSARNRSRRSRSSPARTVEEVDINLKDMLPGLFQGRTKKRRVKVPEALEYLTQEEEQKLIDMDSVARDRGRAGRAGRHHLPRRDRQDRGARRRPRARRQPRRRAARHPADRRRDHGQHASTAWCAPITSCSSPPARFTCRSRRI